MIGFAACAWFLFWAPTAAAAARARIRLIAGAPVQVAPGGTVVVTGSVSGSGSIRLHLYERRGSVLRGVATGAPGAGHAFVLSVHAPVHGLSLLRLRLIAVGARGTRRSVNLRPVRIEKDAPTTASSTTAASVVPPAVVTASPPPGEAGAVTLAGDQPVAAGTVLAVSVGPSTPSGLIGMIVSV